MAIKCAIHVRSAAAFPSSRKLDAEARRRRGQQYLACSTNFEFVQLWVQPTLCLTCNLTSTYLCVVACQGAYIYIIYMYVSARNGWRFVSYARSEPTIQSNGPCSAATRIMCWPLPLYSQTKTLRNVPRNHVVSLEIKWQSPNSGIACNLHVGTIPRARPSSSRLALPQRRHCPQYFVAAMASGSPRRR